MGASDQANQTIVLASGSEHRRKLLENAGVAVSVTRSQIDERAVEVPMLKGGVGPEDIALVLAQAKAENVSERSPGAYVIGADQTLELDGELLHKPDTMEAARRTLLKLSGQTHRLHSAYCIVRNSEVLKSRVESAEIEFRDLTPEEIGQYLGKTGEIALSSVGCYQIEGRGLQLIKGIRGNFFTIVGLPMLPLLNDLRELGLLND
ncbi:septum formation protein Maf [Aureimonas fodinaquatilis]|uniref:Nucleoside triphosphate pyrophosphatase n=1 Tax=Aureimonas fodinaquatilis TaxID=2565783 RepID=A0A5B0DN08_9HYPH|nr:Maf family nucleotide pyrophosphatase [Aureimonas fodinaquatilis]KAA0968247.1 septum formation protein Maf [Aureimonas fodinaquatilis]